MTAAELKTRSVPPSQLSLLGLVRHTGEVERWWLSVHLAGVPDPSKYCTDDNPDGDFLDVADADAEADFALFAREVEMARQSAAGHSLDEVVVSAGHKKDMQLDVQ